MTSRNLLICSVVMALIGTVALVGSLTDAGARIREMYPSAAVTLHEGHSPGVHPLLSIMRVIRGRNFVSTSDWIRVQLSDERQPIDLAILLRFRVNSIQLTRCKINDLAPLTHRIPPVYAEFIDCDLTAVSGDVTAVLQASTENPERLTYGGP
jgi:hypothetical protein